MFDSIFYALTATVFTALSGFLTSQLARRKKERDAEDIETAADIARAATAAAEERKARSLEIIANKLPAGADPDAFIEHLEAAMTPIGKSTPDMEGEGSDANSWSAVENLVSSYHTQALDQARVQFWFSVTAASVGFGLIIYMVTSAENSSETQLLLKALPGVAIDAVAALFFKQASETRQRATALYDRLRADNEKAKALALVRDIDVPEIRAAVQAQIALHMAGQNTETLNLLELVSSKKTTS